jgi:uncharacterized protein
MRLLQSIVTVLIFTVTASAAHPANGDWTGVIKIGDMGLRLAFHITDSANGLQATFDSIDQKVMGMPVDKVEVKGQEITIDIGLIQATYKGTLNKPGTAITGSWLQVGQSFPVNFRKATPVKK